jgi:ABC-type transport system involved in Fe-S cluster assembly fused permease/ATPase subunit
VGRQPPAGACADGTGDGGAPGQDIPLFNESIYFNIAYGRRGATEADVHRAASQAAIHDVIERMPQKYDTVVGERGLKLSGASPPPTLGRAHLQSPELREEAS